VIHVGRTSCTAQLDISVLPKYLGHSILGLLGVERENKKCPGSLQNLFDCNYRQYMGCFFLELDFFPVLREKWYP